MGKCSSKYNSTSILKNDVIQNNLQELDTINGLTAHMVKQKQLNYI